MTTIKDVYNEASKYNSVLEIGCGEGNNLHRIISNIKVGIDAFKPVLESKSYPDVIKMCYDLSNGIPFLNNQFECVIGIDIIEHFEKDKGIELILDCERVAKDCVIFFIPVGNHPQTTDDRGLGNDYYQTHRANWYPNDMEKLKYKVFYLENYHNQENKDSGAMFCYKKIVNK